jgi:hypothetical protein
MITTLTHYLVRRLFFGCLIALALLPRADAQSGLVAAFGFNEGSGATVSDISGNANNGTITGAAWSAAGKFGGALSFDGTSNLVTIADSASLHLSTAMTVEAWVNPAALGTVWRTIVLKEQTGELIYSLYANTDTTRPSGNVFVAAEQETRGTAALALNTWTHVATTYDGTTLRIFVNGVQASSLAVTGGIKSSTGALRIGGNNIWGEFFSGLIDEVRIYNRALSAAELQTDMTTPVGSTAPPPDTTPPTVSMTAPATGATVSGAVTVSATAADNVGVAGVQFLLDGAALGAEDTTAPYSISWTSTGAANGPHTLSARARDGAGNQTTSVLVNVTVSNAAPDTTPPTVSMTAPATGATVSAAVTVSATAADNVGVAGVQFLLDGVALGAEVTAAPYSTSWNSAAATNGPHTLSARARDAAGNQATSVVVNVTVTGGIAVTGLVAAFGFNEGSGTSVFDVSGNNNTGTLNNATWAATGKFGAALAFDGTKSRVDVPDSVSLRLTTGMTLEAWVQPSATLSGWNTVMLKEQTGGLVYALYGNSDTDRPSGHVFVNAEVNTRGIVQVAANVWTHLAATFDGSILRLYVNGAQVSSLAVAGSILPATGALRIGGNAIWGEYFKGMIDEVRVYNRPLSAAEIQTDMTAAVGNGGPPPPDTTPPAISITAPAAGAATGMTTLYANASDNVGVIGVQFYVDGQPFGSEITAFPFTNKWNTATATNTAHTITAIARDLAGNHTTSAPVTVTVSNTNDPTLVGSWTAPFNWPIVAINMVVTRTGEVISWDGPPSNGGTSALSWNPATGVFTPIPNNLTNMFCNAAVVLADGRVLAIGGHADFGVGLRDADIYDPLTKQWTRVASMNHARWYPTATVLPDGRVLVTSGSDTCETCIVAVPEIYDPVADIWTALPAASFTTPFYPLMFVLPDGRVLEAGATRNATVTRVLDLTTQTWTTVDPVPRDGHSAVMYELGKIMKSGSSADVSVSTAPSDSTTFTLDMTQPSPQWQQTPNMAYARSFQNLTLLPDGTVLTVAGDATLDGVDYAHSVLNAELWSPNTKTWRTLAPQQDGRLYHGDAVLLLDGRVLVAGSGRVGPAPQFSGEIFSPPYLFKGPRPTISSAPAAAGYGSNFFVGTPDAAGIGSVTLLRISAATHSFNMDQRILRLNFSPVAGGLTVTAPPNSNVAPPGYYALFALSAAGVPSVAAVIQIQ